MSYQQIVPLPDLPAEDRKRRLKACDAAAPETLARLTQEWITARNPPALSLERHDPDHCGPVLDLRLPGATPATPEDLVAYDREPVPGPLAALAAYATIVTHVPEDPEAFAFSMHLRPDQLLGGLPAVATFYSPREEGSNPSPGLRLKLFLPEDATAILTERLRARPLPGARQNLQPSLF